MDYEKKHKEALEKLQKALAPVDGCEISGLTRACIEEIFPELKQDEDERIRKSIIAILNNYVDNSNTFKPKMLAWLEKQGQKETTLNKENKNNALYIFNLLKDRLCSNNEYDKDILGAIEYCIKNNKPLEKEHIAWLEKQNNTPKEVTCTQEVEVGNGNINALVTEKITIDKIEPKFKVGYWITNGHCICQISFIDSRYWYSETCVLGDITSIDKTFHLWTIQDAKDGDVLANDHHILILKEPVYDWYTNGTPYSVKAYCGIKPNGNFEIGKDNWSFCGTLHIHPATKEQRDILFAKMRESGYEWNAENKELKKVENPAWSEEDEKNLQKAIWYVENPALNVVKDIMLSEWLKSLKQRLGAM